MSHKKESGQGAAENEERWRSKKRRVKKKQREKEKRNWSSGKLKSFSTEPHRVCALPPGKSHRAVPASCMKMVSPQKMASPKT